MESEPDQSLASKYQEWPGETRAYFPNPASPSTTPPSAKQRDPVLLQGRILGHVSSPLSALPSHPLGQRAGASSQPVSQSSHREAPFPYLSTLPTIQFYAASAAEPS